MSGPAWTHPDCPRRPARPEPVARRRVAEEEPIAPMAAPPRRVPPTRERRELLATITRPRSVITLSRVSREHGYLLDIEIVRADHGRSNIRLYPDDLDPLAAAIAAVRGR